MRMLIETDGTQTDLDGPLSFAEVYKLIGCDTLDTVLLADRIHVMLVDDIGLIKGLPINHKATELYKMKFSPRAHASCLIVGNVVIVPDADYD